MSSAGRPPQPPQKHQEEPRKGDHHWSLSKTLIVGIAACLFVCAIANILYAQHHHGSSSGGASILEATAIHAAVENFKNSGVGGGATRKEAKDDSRIRTNEEESDSDEDDDGDGKPLEGEEQDTDDTNLADADEGQQQQEEESEDDDMDDDKKEKGKVDEGVDAMEDNDDVDDNNEKKEEEEDDDDAGVKNDANSAKKDDLASKNAAGDIRLAKLNCSAHGGPAPDFAQEMVYWYDITSDNKYISPFHANHKQHKRYMSFEPDGGGWNNIRMALETVIGLAIAMGRTLVMPAAQRMYLLGKDRGKQKVDFGFADFFPIKEMAAEHAGLDIITMEEFLKKEAMTGNMKDKYTGKVSFPPGNRTDWDGQDIKPLKEWLRNVTHTPIWSPSNCLAAFPASGDHKDAEVLKAMQHQIEMNSPLKSEYIDDPASVDAPPSERLRESLAGRKELCVYNETMQGEPYIHFMCYHKLRVRMLVHFYAFLFFEDWREDLWTKRFMRDHVRYIDEIQCAAARIVHAMREHVKNKKTGSNPNGDFDTFHVRRGDFQFKRTRISADEIYENTKDILEPGASIYIATDERDKKFFNPLKEKGNYDILFMDDFKHLLVGVNTNYYGMIDQLVASRGIKFFGCWHSTFTGFINRMRGYHSVKDKAPGHEMGLLPTTYYYTPKVNEGAMHRYSPLHGAFFNREFPASWRDIDKSIGNLPNALAE